MPSPAGKMLNDAAGVGFPAVTDAVNGTDKGLFGVERFQLAAQVLMWLSMVRSVTTR